MFFDKVRLTGHAVSHDAEAARRALVANEVVHFAIDEASTNAEAMRTYYDQLVEAIGEPLDIAEDFRKGGAPTGKRWSEIRFDLDVPDDAAFRYSKNAQPLHTDESYVSSGAGVMLFYCVSAAPDGGETVFVSGRALVEHLRAADPVLLDRLLTTDVRYRKAEDAKHQPIVRVDHNGSVELNFNYFCADPEQSAEALQLNEDFHRFLTDELPDHLLVPVGLKPGEAVTWRDSLVLHGRNAFTANQSGDRFIWKTGIRLPEAA